MLTQGIDSAPIRQKIVEDHPVIAEAIRRAPDNNWVSVTIEVEYGCVGECDQTWLMLKEHYAYSESVTIDRHGLVLIISVEEDK